MSFHNRHSGSQPVSRPEITVVLIRVNLAGDRNRDTRERDTGT